MLCADGQKVNLVVYMLESNVEHLLKLCQRRFKEVFPEKYFFDSVCTQKETKFLHLRQQDMSVTSYVAKFEALSRYSRSLKDNPQDEWMAIKFEQEI